MSKKNGKNKWDPKNPANHQVRGGGPGASLGSVQMPMEQVQEALKSGRSLTEDSPLEAPVGGHSRDAKLMSPDTRELVLHSRKTEIDKFAEDRGLKPEIVMGIAEAAMRMGKVPDLLQYGVSGDEAKAVKQFIAGEILNIAIEDLPAPGARSVAETTSAMVAPPGMRLGSGLLNRPPIVNADQIDKIVAEREHTTPTLALGAGVTDKPAMTMADIVRLGAEDAARIRNAADMGVRPAIESTQPASPAPSPETATPKVEAETVPEPKGDKIAKPAGEKIGRALKGLGGKLRSPAETAPGQFDNASHGTAPIEKFDITVKEGVNIPSAASLRESRVSAATLRDGSIEETSAPESESGMKLDEAKKWIAGAIKKPGALHKQMGVPEGKKIPAGKLAAAADKGGKLGARARLAQTLKKLHH